MREVIAPATRRMVKTATNRVPFNHPGIFDARPVLLSSVERMRTLSLAGVRGSSPTTITANSVSSSGPNDDVCGHHVGRSKHRARLVAPTALFIESSGMGGSDLFTLGQVLMSKLSRTPALFT